MTSDFKDLLPDDQRKVKYTRKTLERLNNSRFLPLIALAAVVLGVMILVVPASKPGSENALLESDAPSTELDLPIGPDAAQANSDEFELASLTRYEVEDKVRSGDTFETILLRNGVERDYLFPLLEAAKDSHNLNRVVIGRQVKFSFVDSLLSGLEYEIDDDRTLRVSRDGGEVWQASVDETQYVENVRSLSGTIQSSLYETVMDVYSNPELALKLSEIYAWQVDFHNDIRKGDSFKLIFEEKIHPDKQTTKVGNILAAEFTNNGREIYGFRFTNADSTIDYFEPDGASLRRKFLKSPFKYMPRISSRYNPRRFHPILKRYRPHLGVDYAAPKGTPILALGDGVVQKRQWNGGFGNFVLIKHNSMYQTGYGHLSGYAKGLKVGSRVTQGQVIGYVGATGLATGPHLDFRFYKNGKPVNPLTVDIPAGEPVAASVFAQFEAERNYLMRRLDNIGRPLLGPPVVVSTDIPAVLQLAGPDEDNIGG